MNSDALNLRIDRELKKRMAQEAKLANMTITEFVVASLEAATQPFSPWTFHPTKNERQIYVGNDIFLRGVKLLDELLNQPYDQEEADLILRMTVPIRMTIPESRNAGNIKLDWYSEWSSLIQEVKYNITNKRLCVHRLYLFDYSGEADKGVQEDLKQAQSLAKELRQKATEPTPERKRVEVRGTTVQKIMKSPGLLADREYLNDFNIYGKMAVSYTIDTSYNLPFRCMISKDLRDITYWTKRFEFLWQKSFDIDKDTKVLEK